MNLANGLKFFLSAVLLAGSSAGESVAPLRPDFEFDPTPYFEHGYSFHAGIGWSHWRVEGEVLKTEVPEWAHGNKGFDVSYRGGGVKLQYFFSPQQRGAFAGVRTEITRESVDLRSAGLESRPIRHDVGIDAGYRFHLGRGLYITPWGGVDYTFDAHNMEMAGRTYKDARFGIFAAVHVGYRF
jgi:hypothetical protein